MQKFAIAMATLAASGLGAAVLGLATPAQAAPPAVTTATTISTGVDHLGWLDQIHPKVNVPKVDTTVRHSGR